MPLARVQATGKVTADNAPSVALPFAAPPVVGNGVVVGVISNAGGGFSATACTDNRGNTYLRALVQGGNVGTESLTVYYCPKITAAGAPFIVTISPAVGNVDFVAIAIEIGGVGGGLVVGHSSSTIGISTTPNGLLNITSGTEYVVIALTAIAASQTSLVVSTGDGHTPGWTQEVEELPYGPLIAGEIDSRILTTPNGFTMVSWAGTGSGWWVFGIVAFAATAEAPPVAANAGWLLGEDFMANRYNLYKAITPSDTLDLATPTDAIIVGVAGTVAAVMENGQVSVLTLPAGWAPIVARRINATGTTATGLTALNDV